MTTTQHLTDYLVASAIAESDPRFTFYVQPAEGWGCELSFHDEERGVLTVDLYDDTTSGPIETRKFRLVEVTE